MKIPALLSVLFFLVTSCKTTENTKPLENKSLRDSLRVLTDSLQKYQTTQVHTEAKNIPSLKVLYKKLKPAVFLIYTVDNLDTAQGSGFFVDSTGIAISNYHVFESAGRAIAQTDDSSKYPISQILDYSEDKDYVVFRVNTGGLSVPFIKKHSDDIDIGDDCFAVGNPEGLSQTLSTGIISGVRFGGKIIQTTTPITFGSSGGPLFNREGEAIGITSGGMGSGNLNFAINLDQIPFEKFLNTKMVPPLPDNIESLIKEKLTSYFGTLTGQEFSKTSDFFTDNLYRFYTKFNITNQEAASSLEADWKKSGIVSGKIRPHWKTLSVSRNLWAYEAKLNADYDLIRAEKKKPSHFNLDMIVEFNKDLLIQSMYENVLAKSN